ncbi:hypothetical protein F5884DRAFT_901288 [Xylogone sp. PMI_703]|nr:hypothetical protein F5884DRAFT_901288 [Xylogone sp. PMI_703]
MFKAAVRAAPRRIAASNRMTASRTSQRFLSTAPPSQRSRNWKNGALRWALAAGGLYYYNTSPVFAEEPEASIQQLDASIHDIQESKLPTIDAIVEERRLRQAREAEAREREAEAAAAAAASQSVAVRDDGAELEGGEGGMGSLEDDAANQGAFNPETGEINWDCPCLGGMAHGPCGEEFKAAFSCFVYSNEEPKGVECIDKFKGMQDCFRLHPEMYGSELEDDEEEVEAALHAREAGDDKIPEIPSDKTSAPTPDASSAIERSSTTDEKAAPPSGTTTESTEVQAPSKETSPNSSA